MSITRFKECVRDGFSNPDLASKLYKGGGSSTNTVTNADPWSGAQPYMKDYMREAKGLSMRPQSFVPDSFGSDTERSFGMLRNFSNTDPTYGRTGMDSLQSTARGDYLNGNPYLDSILNKSMDQTNAMFQGGGRYGSAGHAGSMAANLGGIRYQNYADERQNQMDASKFLPMGQQMMDSSIMSRIGARQGVGGMLDADRTARWDFNQNEPWNRLQRYASIINPGAGMGGTQSSSGTGPGGSRLAGAAGGAMAGYAMAPAVAGIFSGGGGAAGGAQAGSAAGPYGAAAGALLGAIAGAYL